MNTRLIAVLLLVGIAMVQAAPNPPSTEELLARATQRASVEKKAIYVHCTASWCGWCKRHEAFLDEDGVLSSIRRSDQTRQPAVA